MNCHREPCPVSRKSLVGCPDQRECRWLAIRCKVGQESYVRQQEENKRDNLASISGAHSHTAILANEATRVRMGLERIPLRQNGS